MKTISSILAIIAGIGAASAQQAVTTYQGTMTLSSATSTQLITANVTLAPNSAALPTSWSGQTLTVLNVGATNPLVICWSGGTASATSGCETLAAGTRDTVTIFGAGPPTLFSTSGTTVAFRQGL